MQLGSSVNQHTVYLRGYNEEEGVLIGHNSFGSEYKPKVYIPSTEERQLDYFKIDVTKIEREDDRVDKLYFYFNDDMVHR
jgi:hypothetical protein